MGLFDFSNNPGVDLGGILTSQEILLVQHLAGLGDPGADRILFFDESAGGFAYLTAGTGLSITGTTITATGSGTGDFSTNTATSVLNELVLFADTTGKLGKRATGTGVGYLTSGVLSISKVTLTQPATGSTLTILDGKTLTVNNTITLAGTDAQTYTFPTTSATIARTDAANTFTGHQTIEGVTTTGATGTGKLVFDGTPTLVTPVLGVASATTINKVTFTTPASGSTLTIIDGKTLTINKTMSFNAADDTGVYTLPTGTATLVATTVTTLSSLVSVGTITTGTWSATTIAINKGGTGVTSVTTAPAASAWAGWDANSNFSANNLIEGFTTTATAAGTTTMVIGNTYQQYWTGASTQTIKLPTTGIVAGQQYQIVNQSSGLVTVQSSGANTIVILAASTSAIFTAVVATPTTAANWSASYAGVNTASGKVATINNTITFAGTDATTMTFPSTSATIARTDAANTFTGHQTIEGVTSTGATGTGKLVFDGSPTLVTPNIGTATAASVIYTNNAIAASGNAATVPVTSRLSTVTNNSAATLTITITTAGATDGQLLMVRILDFSAVTQTITWVNTENSTVTAPTTSNGSTTLFLTAGFIYNGGTSKWRCIASA